jgi:hypothetical protein
MTRHVPNWIRVLLMIAAIWVGAAVLLIVLGTITH